MDEPYLDVGDSLTHEAILPVMHGCWGVGMSLDAYRDFLAEVDGHPWARRQIRTLVLKSSDGDCLSALALHAVRALHDGEEIWFGGIARVITPEHLRGRGHASRLMRATIDLLKGEGIDGAYLFSDIDPAFYERFGFTTIDRQQVDLPLEELSTGIDPAGVRPLQEDDWPAIWEIHARAGRGEALWLLREPEHWDYLVGRALSYGRHHPTYPIEGVDRVIGGEGDVAAYAIARVHGDAIELFEFGMDSPDQATLDRLLGSLRAEGEARGCKRFTASWPPGKWRSLFESRFPPVDRKEGIYMVAPLSARLDLPEVVKRVGGSWQTDHI